MSKCMKCEKGISEGEFGENNGLCAECYFDIRIMEEALALGYGMEPDVAIGGSGG